MKPARVLVSVIGCPDAWVEALNAQVQGIADLPLVVRHERFNTANVTEQLSAVLLRFVPDLLILMFSETEQSAAPALLDSLCGQNRPPPVVVVPGSDSPNSITELFQHGASDYLLPPFRPSDVQPRLLRLLAHRRAEALPVTSLKESLGLQQIVGESPALLEQIRKIPRLARCDACVLITGETGTGKEVCARAVHARDENYAPLEENFERLSSARHQGGGKLEVISLPSPEPLCYEGARLPASYANFYIANELVLVPIFGDPADATALGLLGELFPGRRVVGLRCSEVVAGLGALHCVTQQEPRAG
jgi:AmiR/NasT family two-component response regulator